MTKTTTQQKPTLQRGKLKNMIEETEVLAKWICLYQAINLISEECEKMGVDFDKIEISPLKIRKYIDSTVDVIHRSLMNDMYKIKTVYSEND
jgi:predicted RNA-binding protein with PUA domain